MMRPTERMMRQDDAPDTAAQVALARAKSDPAARALLEATQARMYAWPQHFPGYRATLHVNDEGQEVRGEVTVSTAGEVHVHLSDHTGLRDWVQERLWLQAMHLLYRSFELGDGRYVVTFGEPPTQRGRHPRGVQVVLQGGRMASWYRIADYRYTQISRTLPGQHRHINTLERYDTAPDGRLYATHYVMAHFHDSEAQLPGIESYVNTFCEVSGCLLPSRRMITMSADGALRTREIVLEAPRLLT